MGGASSFEECITHGPWGGSKGKDWIYMPESFIKRITIVHAGVIDRIRFQSDFPTSETQSSIFGGNGGENTDTICFDYPNEYLTSISGTIGHFGGHTVVTSLCFQTNQIRYGPYGSESGSCFSYDGNGGVIVGFHGRAGRYIDAIGIFVIPKSQLLYRNFASREDFTYELCCRLSRIGMPRVAGLWGAVGGKPWDDGVFSHIKQVHIYMGESLKVIFGIQFEYVKRDGESFLSKVHGGGRGVYKTEQFDLEGVEKYLTGISGFYGPDEGFDGLEGITSITFHTNKRNHRPFGQESSGEDDVSFTSTGSSGKIVGFHGRNDDFLTAIGVHMEYF